MGSSILAHVTWDLARTRCVLDFPLSKNLQVVPRLAEFSRGPCGELRAAALTLLASLSEEPACCEALVAPLPSGADCLDGARSSRLERPSKAMLSRCWRGRAVACMHGQHGASAARSGVQVRSSIQTVSFRARRGPKVCASACGAVCAGIADGICLDAMLASVQPEEAELQPQMATPAEKLQVWDRPRHTLY